MPAETEGRGFERLLSRQPRVLRGSCRGQQPSKAEAGRAVKGSPALVEGFDGGSVAVPDDLLQPYRKAF